MFKKKLYYLKKFWASLKKMSTSGHFKVMTKQHATTYYVV